MNIEYARLKKIQNKKNKYKIGITESTAITIDQCLEQLTVRERERERERAYAVTSISGAAGADGEGGRRSVEASSKPSCSQ